MGFLIRVSSGLLQPPIGTGPRITTDASTYNVGDTVTATVTNGPAGAQNAVGLYHSDDDPTTAMPVDWRYLANNAKTPQPSAGVASGSVTFDLTGLVPDTFDVVLTDVPFVQINTNIYYVSPTGNNSLDGHSTLTAWQTIAKINATVFQPGNQILFEGGQTFSGSMSFTATSWVGATATNPITIGSYGTGRATISSGAASGFKVLNNAGFVLQDLIFVGNGAADVNGVNIYNALAGAGKLSYVRGTNLDISGYGRHGFSILGGYGPAGTGTDTAGFDDVVLDNVIAHGCCNVHQGNVGTAGIRVQGFYGFNKNPTLPTHTNVTVRNCKSHDNLGWHSGTTAATSWTGSGIVFGSVQFGTIEYCETYNNGAQSITVAGPAGIMAFDSDSVFIQRCESHHNHSGSSSDGIGIDIDGGMTNSSIVYCYTHNNDGPGLMLFNYLDATAIVNWDNNIIGYCISENDALLHTGGDFEGAIAIGSNGVTLTNLRVYNNTIFNSGANSTCIHLGKSAANTMTGLIANNILYSSANAWLVNTSAQNPTSVLFRGNNYYAAGTFRISWNNVTYSTLAAWRTATSQEIRSSVNLGLSTDPLLNNPGLGGTVGGLLNVDADDNILPPDLPAYQLQDVSPMIDAGLNLLKLFSVNPGEQDFYLTTLPQGATWDIGACESTSIPAQVSELSESWTGADNDPWSAANWLVKEWDDNASSITIQGNAGRITVGGHAYTWAHVGSIVNVMTDFDLRVTLQLSSGTGEQYHCLHFRVPSGVSPAWSVLNSNRPTKGYEVNVWINAAGVSYLSFTVIDSDAYVTATQVNVTTHTWGTATWNLRVQMIGPDVKVKAWQGTSEPANWDIQTSDGRFTTGHFMMSAENGADAVTHSATWDTLSIVSATAPVVVNSLSENWTGNNGDAWNPDRWPRQLAKGASTSKVWIQGNTGELYTNGAAYAWARASSNVTDMGDFNLTFTLRMPYIGEQYHYIFVRSGNAMSTVEPWRPTDGLQVLIWCDGNNSNNGVFEFTPIIDDAYHTNSDVSVDKPGLGTSTWNVHIQMIGNAFKARMWQGSEPSTWDIETPYDLFTTGTLRLSALSGANANNPKSGKYDNMALTQVLIVPVAVNDSAPFNLWTGNHDVDVLNNDTYVGTPTISITSQSGPGTATVVGTGTASRIRVPTDGGLSAGTKSVTYQLTATGSSGSSSATLTSVLTAVPPTFVGTPALIANTTGATTQNFNYTVGAGANCLGVLLYNDAGQTFTSVTWTPTGGSAVDMGAARANTANGNTRCALYALANPVTGAGVISVVISSVNQLLAVPFSLSGWNQGTLTSNQQNGGNLLTPFTPSALAITPANNTLLIHGVCIADPAISITFAGGETEDIDSNGGSIMRATMSHKAVPTGGATTVGCVFSGSETRYAEIVVGFGG